MKELIVIFIGLLTVQCDHISIRLHEWSSYKTTHSKSYHNEHEDFHRMDTFMKRKTEIEQHNRLFDAGQVTFKMALNRFSDLTDDEFTNFMDGLRIFEPFQSLKENRTKSPQQFYTGQKDSILPTSIDWRKKGAVTSVKDQGENCGACWAFSATGALEGQHFRKTGQLISLSPQNLVDCTDSHGHDKCNGRSRHEAFEWIKDHRGIESDKIYPYEGKGGSCKYNQKLSAATLRDYMNIPSGDEMRLQEAIATVGPISVLMDASHQSFWYYASGIYYEPKCSENTLTHAVLAVGFGSDEKGREFYIIKNSWNEYWGENGYMRLARNKKNHCGIASSATYPIV